MWKSWLVSSISPAKCMSIFIFFGGNLSCVYVCDMKNVTTKQIWIVFGHKGNAKNWQKTHAHDVQHLRQHKSPRVQKKDSRSLAFPKIILFFFRSRSSVQRVQFLCASQITHKQCENETRETEIEYKIHMRRRVEGLEREGGFRFANLERK